MGIAYTNQELTVPLYDKKEKPNNSSPHNNRDKLFLFALLALLALYANCVWTATTSYTVSVETISQALAPNVLQVDLIDKKRSLKNDDYKTEHIAICAKSDFIHALHHVQLGITILGKFSDDRRIVMKSSDYVMSVDPIVDSAGNQIYKGMMAGDVPFWFRCDGNNDGKCKVYVTLEHAKAFEDYKKRFAVTSVASITQWAPPPMLKKSNAQIPVQNS